MNTFKKILGILLIAVASVVMLIPADKASAAYTSVNFGKEYNEFIDSKGTYFKVDIPKSGKVTIEGDTDIEEISIDAYNAKEEYVVELGVSSRKHITGINEFIFSEELLSGTYYFRIDIRSDEEGGKVSFRISLKESGETFLDSQDNKNNTATGADIIYLNKQYKGHLAVNDEQDYYKITISEDGQYIFSGDSVARDFLGVIRAADGEKISCLDVEGSAVTDNYRFKEKVALKKGTYYINFYIGYYGSYGVDKSLYIGNYSFGIYEDKVRLEKTENLSVGIRLTWSYDGESKDFNIFKKTDGNAFEKIAKVSNTTFTDSDVKNGVFYSYKIAPADSTDSSSYSDTKKIKRLTGVSITSIKRNGSEIEVKFTENKKADGYKIYYCTDDSFEASKTKSIKTSKLSGKITGLKKDKTYYVRVRAYSMSGDTSYNGVYTAKKKVTSKNCTKKYVIMKNVSKVTASSKLKSTASYTYGADNLIDGSLANAWCEGVSGYGEGESVTLTLDGSYIVSGMKINAGYQKSLTSYYDNSRPKKIKVSFSNGKSLTYTLTDVMEKQTIDFGSEIETKYVKIEIVSVYKGNKYKDTLISEIKLT